MLEVMLSRHSGMSAWEIPSGTGTTLAAAKVMDSLHTKFKKIRNKGFAVLPSRQEPPSRHTGTAKLVVLTSEPREETRKASCGNEIERDVRHKSFGRRHHKDPQDSAILLTGRGFHCPGRTTAPAPSDHKRGRLWAAHRPMLAVDAFLLTVDPIQSC